MSDPLSLNTIYSRLWQAFGFPAPEVEDLPAGALHSTAAVTDFASASIAVAGAQLAQLSNDALAAPGSTGTSLLTGLIIACIL